MGPTTETPSFERDIKPLFTSAQRDCMRRERNFDLHQYEDVRDRAARIYDVLRTGEMPLDASPWSEEWLDTFKSWMDAGCPP